MNAEYPTIELPHTILLQTPVTGNTFKILNATDDPNSKTVNALVQVGPQGSNNWFYVWSGDAYDEIGNWTDAQLAEEIKNQITGLYPQYNI
jgi:hypothetical protein